MRDRNQMRTPKSGNLPFHATLLVGPFQPRGRELRREQIMRAQRDEPVRLDPPAALEHLLHRRLQIVKPEAREDPAPTPAPPRGRVPEHAPARSPPPPAPPPPPPPPRPRPPPAGPPAPAPHPPRRRQPPPRACAPGR